MAADVTIARFLKWLNGWIRPGTHHYPGIFVQHVVQVQPAQ
nr:hypothetical protein [Acinetobacter baumannii]